MPADGSQTRVTLPVTYAENADCSVLAVDTGTSEGRAFMASALRAGRIARHMQTPLARVRSALDSHRRTQADRTGFGYYASPAESRAAVLARVAEAKACRAELDDNNGFPLPRPRPDFTGAALKLAAGNKDKALALVLSGAV